MISRHIHPHIAKISSHIHKYTAISSCHINHASLKLAIIYIHTPKWTTLDEKKAKIYLLVFTCRVLMAEHPELVDNMSVKSFLQDFMSFVTSVFKPGGYTPTPTTDRGNSLLTLLLDTHMFSRNTISIIDLCCLFLLLASVKCKQSLKSNISRHIS